MPIHSHTIDTSYLYYAFVREQLFWKKNHENTGGLLRIKNDS